MKSMTKAPIASTGLQPKLKYLHFPFSLLPKYSTYLNLVKYKLNPGHAVSMNPFKKWFTENVGLETYTTNYFRENLYLLEDNLELKNDCEVLFSNGFLGKFRVLTLLSAVKQFRG